MEDAVDAEADAVALVLGVDVDIGGPAIEGARDDLVEDIGRGGGGGDFAEFDAEVAFELGAVGAQGDGPGGGSGGSGSAAGEVNEASEGEGVEPVAMQEVQFDDGLAEVDAVILAVADGGLELFVGEESFFDEAGAEPLVDDFLGGVGGRSNVAFGEVGESFEGQGVESGVGDEVEFEDGVSEVDIVLGGVVAGLFELFLGEEFLLDEDGAQVGGAGIGGCIGICSSEPHPSASSSSAGR